MAARHQAPPDAGGQKIVPARLLRVVLPAVVAATAVVIVALQVSGSNARRTELADAAPGSTVVAAPVPVTSSSPTRTQHSGATTRANQTPSAARTVAVPGARAEAKPGTDPRTEITSLTAGLGDGGVSVAAVNLTTGTTFTFGATAGMVMGSVAKVDILETLLLQHQDAKELLTDDDVDLATSMIEHSDNDAADSLWAEIGSDPAVSAANQRLGVPTLDVGTEGYWGLGTTSASQQLVLLRNLVATTSPLDAASQAFALNLMRTVEADQRWGVGVIADAGTSFANKNGWLSNDDDDERWLINSDAVVTVHGQQLLVSVLTQHNATEDDGINLVEDIATALVPALVH